jgi:hypothetical protein
VISGYQIYVSPEQSLADLPLDSPEVQACLWQAATYPGDTDPRTDVETARLLGLEDGVLYYIHVRTVGPEGTIGPPSDEIAVIPRPAGQIRLVPRHAGREDGYSFAEQRHVRARDAHNDIYLFVRHDSVFAASPHRLAREHRYVEFHEIGPSSSIAEYPTMEISGKGETKMHLQQGFTYILSTPENCLAKLYVARIAGTGDRTVVIIDYVFQPRCGYAVF